MQLGKNKLLLLKRNTSLQHKIRTYMQTKTPGSIEELQGFRVDQFEPLSSKYPIPQLMMFNVADRADGVGSLCTLIHIKSYNVALNVIIFISIKI